MTFDCKLEDANIIISCSKGLESFSREFINYYNRRIDRIRDELDIADNIKVKVFLTDDEKNAGFVYGKTSFSGYYTDFGAFAYINLNGGKDKEYMFKGLIHELIHHFYNYYVYGIDKERIVWADEGIAELFSNKYDEYKDEDKYRLFLYENLKDIDSINLNELKHDDRSFGNNNGYKISYIAIRYLYENNTHQDFINIIKNREELLKYGQSIIKEIKNKYDIDRCFGVNE